jgi:hypothetical protein
MSYPAVTAIAVRVTALFAAVMAPFLVAADVDSAGRTVTVAILFAVAPGAAILSPLRIDSVAAELGLVVGISFAVTIVGAQAMLIFDAWSPDTATYVLSLACFLGLMWGLGRSGSGAA